MRDHVNLILIEFWSVVSQYATLAGGRVADVIFFFPDGEEKQVDEGERPRADGRPDGQPLQDVGRDDLCRLCRAHCQTEMGGGDLEGIYTITRREGRKAVNNSLTRQSSPRIGRRHLKIAGNRRVLSRKGENEAEKLPQHFIKAL